MGERRGECDFRPFESVAGVVELGEYTQLLIVDPHRTSGVDFREHFGSKSAYGECSGGKGLDRVSVAAAKEVYEVVVEAGTEVGSAMLQVWHFFPHSGSSDSNSRADLQ